MNVLSRSEIITLFKSKELKIETTNNHYESVCDNAYSKDSPFQQCSIDLHVGSIYVPELNFDDLGGMSQPRTDGYVLGTGGTVLIKTNEKITLPNNVGAICFSPSSTALKGVMITNMGHVDPGYSGYLHFTVINMGKGPYGIRANIDILCTIILFKLTENAVPYGSEYIKTLPANLGSLSISGSVYFSLPKLSKDFVNVEKRAQDAAEKIFDKTKLYQIGVPLLAALVVSAFSLFQIFFTKPWEVEVQKTNIKIEALEKKLSYEKRIAEMEINLDRIEKTKNILNTKGTTK
ncbi:dCTP deaminase [Methylovulum miyakonense]|uniref:dCTP deaminase n=1 Tax=Methylovulum miyakonense TaxID=645578 RepID=UPI00037C6303|nr:hypothetical protein [Methylovulum miyakonense]